MKSAPGRKMRLGEYFREKKCRGCKNKTVFGWYCDPCWVFYRHRRKEVYGLWCVLRGHKKVQKGKEWSYCKDCQRQKQNLNRDKKDTPQKLKITLRKRKRPVEFCPSRTTNVPCEYDWHGYCLYCRRKY